MTFKKRDVVHRVCFRTKREQLQRVSGRLPESQGHNRDLTVLYVPYSLDRSQGHLARKKQPPPLGPPWDPRHIPTVGS